MIIIDYSDNYDILFVILIIFSLNPNKGRYPSDECWYIEKYQ